MQGIKTILLGIAFSSIEGIALILGTTGIGIAFLGYFSKENEGE
ncbi:MAG: hypothetical protein E6370_08685 [Clostridiales bacterium]|nr:hypothetical protein [Clostridiales bacterium]MDU6974388.1 hypothetical protein [Clostridiales bacterium]